MAQFVSYVTEHNAAHATGDKPATSARNEFSLDGLPEGNAADLVAVGERIGAVERI